jgi:hypothetical protein
VPTASKFPQTPTVKQPNICFVKILFLLNKT